MVMEIIKTDQSIPVANGVFRSSVECLFDGMEEFGGILGLWEQAAEWGQNKKTFRRWWVRAAMAQGHAEWLEKEPYHLYSPYTPLPHFRITLLLAKARSTGTQSLKPTPPLESWRLWPPGMPGSYVHDCAVVAGEAM